MPRPVYNENRPAGRPLPCGRGSGWCALLIAALVLATVPAAAQQALEPSGFINDYADVLSTLMEAKLEGLARELQQKTGAEVAVAAVRTLEGDSVENYANLLAERWGVGDENDRGALLLLAVDDRKLRLEVGYGLEPLIPDGRAGQILDVMTPLLRQGDYDTAIALGVSETAQIIAADAGVELTGVPQELKRRQRRPSFVPWIWLTIILILALLPRRRRQGAWHDDAVTTAWWLGNIGGRGGGGGWGSGGGGFGGFGGGGFGGGGASRGW